MPCNRLPPSLHPSVKEIKIKLTSSQRTILVSKNLKVWPWHLFPPEKEKKKKVQPQARLIYYQSRAIWMWICIEIKETPQEKKKAFKLLLSDSLQGEKNRMFYSLLREPGTSRRIVSVLPLTCDSLPLKHPWLLLRGGAALGYIDLKQRIKLRQWMLGACCSGWCLFIVMMKQTPQIGHSWWRTVSALWFWTCYVNRQQYSVHATFSKSLGFTIHLHLLKFSK